MKVEKWKSNYRSREDHYYRKKKEQYLFGVNTKLISKKTVRKILKLIKKEL